MSTLRSLEAQLASLKSSVLSIDTGLILPVALMALPVLLLPYYLLTRPSKKNTYDPSTGIGRGAPGFQTGSTRVALPASIVARIRMGEEVGSEEITEALEEEERKRKEEEEERRRQREADERGEKRLPPGVDPEWLPAGAASTALGKRNQRKRK